MKYKLLKPIQGIDTKVGEEIDISENKIDSGWKLQLLLEALLVDNGYIEEYDSDKKWEPEKGDIVWYIMRSGVVDYASWDPKFASGYEFLGKYKAKEEAELAAQKIKQFISNGMK